MTHSNEDIGLAVALARTAGDLLLTLQRSSLLEGKALGKLGDKVSNAFIMAMLATARPGDAVLSEEEKDNHDRLKSERVWIVDPLDGTREYGEGRQDWAVHIALAVAGLPGVGAVALPGRGLVLRSDAKLNAAPRSSRKIRMLVSRTRPPREAERIARELDAELIPMGSAGAKAMAVVLGEGDIYLHAGGQYEWDNCAPAAVALGTGLHASRLDGSPLLYNNEDPTLPDLLICAPEIADIVLTSVKNLGSAI